MKTDRIHLSPGITDLPLRLLSEPDKQTATLGEMTGGRVEPGLGNLLSRITLLKPFRANVTNCTIN
jgi:hypothetical protein